MDSVSSCIWDITKKNDVYNVKDYPEGSTEILYYGEGIFKSADKEKTYTVIKNDKDIECIHLQDGKSEKTYYPFCSDNTDASKLKVYEGSYYCNKLGVSYNVKAYDNKLFIKNGNLHNNAVDLYYTHALKDTFISVPNSYIDYYCVTFNRDNSNQITSFSYRDDAQSLREKFVFVRMD